MSTKEQAAAEDERNIQDFKVRFLEALKAFNYSKSTNEPIEKQIKWLDDWSGRFDALVNYVESCIARSELLGANRSEFWAQELANTASNLLDAIPDYYERFWSEAKRLNQRATKPSPNAFTAMQNAVLIYNPDQVDGLRKRFEAMNLPVRGFERPAAMNTPAGTTPDLTESFIILLISTAIVIFMFWIATQALGEAKFSNLPPYIVSTFSSIWTSVATGAAGIGLALVKAFTSRNRPQPNYLKYIALTTAGLLIPITVIIAALPRPKSPVALQPPNTVTIKADAKARDFDLEGPGPLGGPVTYVLRGTFTVSNATVIGHLKSGYLKVGPVLPPGMLETSVTRISFRDCYIDQRQPTVLRQIFPVAPKARDSVDVNFPIIKDASYELPEADFSFDLPDQKFMSSQWLCAALTNQYGYYPAE